MNTQCENEHQRLNELRQITPSQWLSEHDAAPEKFGVQSYYDQVIHKVEKLRMEDKLEFIDERKGIRVIGKLVWINPTTSNYLFATRNGRLLAIKSKSQLIQAILDCKVRLINPDVELLSTSDRARRQGSLQNLLDKVLPAFSYD